MNMIIGGKLCPASDGARMEVLNPATLERIDDVPSATREDIDRALTIAREGFAEWSAVPLHERIERLKAFVRLFRKESEALALSLRLETGKTKAQAQGCIDGSAALMDAYIECARTVGGTCFPFNNSPDAGDDLRVTIREPLGVVACILPFNFPIDSFAHKVIPALLMGNAVVIKPASATPLTDIRTASLLLEAGVCPSAVNVLTGSGASVGAQLSSDRRVNMVNLTGSTRVGMEIARRCADGLRRVHLELGGNDPLIILEDADVEEAADKAFAARIGNCGQVCCAAKRFIVHNGIRGAFIEKLIARLKTVKVGDPEQEDTTCGPLISSRAAEELSAQIDHCVRQGARVLYGGHRLGGAFFEPTVLDLPADADAARDLELFGPVWSVIGFDALDEAISIANASAYGLSSGVIGHDFHEMLFVARRIQAGACVIGDSGAYRPFDQPFGGYGISGIGREGGIYTLEEMSQLKTIVLK